MDKEFGGDVLIFDSEEGGEISVVNGLVLMDRGFSSAVYLSLFGGNGKDLGDVASNNTWWGNKLEDSLESEKLVSRFVSFISSEPLTSKNLILAEDKIQEDLKWFVDDGIADLIEVEILDAGNNRIQVDIKIGKDGEMIESGRFGFQWEVMKNGI